MTARIPLLLGALAAAVLLSSCTYEPYRYGSRSYSSSSLAYRSSGAPSTSVFISTGNSRWGYDPHCRSYYDYKLNCYYDPYLRGYYPRGYRPPVIVGVPHPHGWHRGRKHCPPPSHVRDHRIRDYRKRHHHYANLNHSWARSLGQHRHSDRHRAEHKRSYRNPNTYSSGSHRLDPMAPRSMNSNWNRSDHHADRGHASFSSRHSPARHSNDHARFHPRNSNIPNHSRQDSTAPANRSNSHQRSNAADAARMNQASANARRAPAAPVPRSNRRPDHARGPNSR